MRKRKFSYSNTGVDINIEAKAARILYQASKQSWSNRQKDLGEIVIPFDNFSGLRYFEVENLPQGTVSSGGSDGIATKAEISERANRFDTAGFDLLAMVCDDAVIRGAEPIIIKSVLEVNTLGKDQNRLHYIEQLAKGYVKAAKEANVVIINGEIAQLNNRMGKLKQFMFNWSADVTWFAHKSRLLSGSDIKIGDYLVGLSEPGFRCNGLSLPRIVFKNNYGKDWGNIIFKKKRIIDEISKPSIIYTKAVVDIFGGWNLNRRSKAKLHGAAHITGGGIPEKLGRSLKPSGFGALINDPYSPNPLMLHCQELGHISDSEAYNTWNMGQGMILISPTPQEIIKVVKSFGIEAKIIGQITKDPRITIKSQGIDGGALTFLSN